MFGSAVRHLTLWYVGVLVVVCILFSAPAYAVGSARLRQGAQRQFEVISQSPYASRFELKDLERDRTQRLQNDQQALLFEIIVVDMIIIAIGSFLGYLFAKQTLQPIEEAHNRQARFTADASHELRTPLAVLQTEIDVALRNPKLKLREAREVLASNREEITRLKNLSDQLLTLTKVQATGLEKQRINLTDALRREAKVLSRRYGIRIETNLLKDVHLVANKALLLQLLGILVDNSVKYAVANKPDVSISLSKTSRKVVLVVTDHGMGIDAKDLPHIFERFRRGDHSTIGGQGLGLAIAANIVDAHGGVISAASTDGKTSITVILPL